ncbi:hypothetical protein ASE04_18710 [Rhizobium sp. Root708]|uniref:hypothetical protein n=1 Tax=Rhizobium sp. Root708 TaxID=1736592 RepID=UPI0006FF60A5|nr:hypothetical protein [Rhizobium sp. Root708]KRB49210.1 hypothetical protein ASE04_18710 [Rhizobium sp. Root708]
MKKLAVLVAIVLAGSPALAISRLSPLKMTCDQARATVHNQGAVIFRWTSPRGLPLYDRFVRNGRYCDPNEYAEWKRIPTRDNRACLVLFCENLNRLDGDFIIPDNSL